MFDCQKFRRLMPKNPESSNGAVISLPSKVRIVMKAATPPKEKSKSKTASSSDGES